MVSEEMIPKHLPAPTSKADESPRGRSPADSPEQTPSPSERERRRVRPWNADRVSIRVQGPALRLLRTLRE